jgi:hypothetical protein
MSKPVISQIALPEFVDIMFKCKEKMIQTFKKYGNTWLNHNGLKFWKKRIDGEIDEIWKAKTFEEYQKEIIDAINILSMMYDRYDDWFFDKEVRTKGD